MRNYTGILAAILLLGLGLRSAAAFVMPWFSTDSHVYFAMADAILAGEPLADFPNGYPLLVAAARAILPEGAVAPGLVGLQVALSTATIALTFLIARDVSGGNRITPVLAALCVACWPNQINYTRQLLSEVPATFLLALALWLLVRWRAAAAGILFQFAGTFRSTLLPVGPLLAVLLIAFRRDARTVLRLALGLGVAWALHQSLVLLDVVQPPSNLQANLLRAIRPHEPTMQAALESFTDDERAHPLRTYGSFVLSHPAEFARQRARTLWRLWGPWASAGDPDSPRGLVRRMLIGLRTPLLLLAIPAFVLSLRRKIALEPMHAWMLALPVLAVSAVHVAFFAEGRFTFTLEPLLAVLAANTVVSWWRRQTGEVRVS